MRLRQTVSSGFLESCLTADSPWHDWLAEEFRKDYIRSLESFLLREAEAGKTLFPPRHLCFNALNNTAPERVKVVILGQDPYHGPGQAHGLCFSVPPLVAIPPSLLNIFKEIERSLGLERPSHGCLGYWAQQGVLLLNSVLTVEAHQAGSHANKGWETFTDAVIEELSTRREGLVFMLWGSYAQRKGRHIDASRHLVLRAPHPSPLSVHRGYIGCDHFQRCNAYLRENGSKAVDWRLPPSDRLDEHGFLSKKSNVELAD